MLPLVHNTIVRNRSNTIPTNSNRSTGTNTTSNDANNQYGGQNGSRDSSDSKKLKSGKVCMTTNATRPLFRRSITLGSILSFRPSRSASTNSLDTSAVEDTIAAVLRSQSRDELLSGFCINPNASIDENTLLNNLVKNSYNSDVNIHSNNQSSNEYLNGGQSTNDLNNQSNFNLNRQSSSTPSYPPPKYTPSKRRPLFLRSHSAPHHSSELLTNASILANIPQNTDSSTLTVLREEEELEMASRRNSHFNHQYNCKLAHEKELIHIPGFNSKEELFERISNAFKVNLDQILYCTLNSPSIDDVFDQHISPNDIINVHLRGRAKEIEIEKTETMLGLTICDNSKGLCLIKKIKPGSVIDKIKFINVGDIIESINGTDLHDCRHIFVANMLKAIPIGKVFVIRLIESIRNPDESNSSSMQLGRQLRNKIKKGYKTLRIRSKEQGPPIFEELDVEDEATKKINSIIEDFVGISDSELTQQLRQLCAQSSDPNEFLKTINESDLKMFNFSEEVLFDIWGTCAREDGQNN